MPPIGFFLEAILPLVAPPFFGAVIVLAVWRRTLGVGPWGMAISLMLGLAAGNAIQYEPSYRAKEQRPKEQRLWGPPLVPWRTIHWSTGDSYGEGEVAEGEDRSAQAMNPKTSGKPKIAIERGWRSLLLAVLIALLIECLAGDQQRWRWYARGLACFLVAWLLVEPGLGAVRMAMFALVLVALWFVLDRSRQCVSGVTMTLAFSILWAMPAAIVLHHAHIALFAQLGLLVSATLFGSACAAGRQAESRVVTPFAITSISGLMWLGATEAFSKVPLATFALLGLAPLTLVALAIPFFQRQPRVAFVLLLAMPTIAAVILAASFESMWF